MHPQPGVPQGWGIDHGYRPCECHGMPRGFLCFWLPVRSHVNQWLHGARLSKLSSRSKTRSLLLGSRLTLTDLDSICPGSLLKTTPTLPGYPWVSGGQYVTPEYRFSGLGHDHQGLENLLFLINFGSFWGFFGSGIVKSWWSNIKPLNLGSGSYTDPKIPMGTQGAVRYSLRPKLSTKSCFMKQMRSFERAKTNLKMLIASWFLVCFFKRLQSFNDKNLGSVGQRAAKLPAIKLWEWFEGAGVRTRAHWLTGAGAGWQTFLETSNFDS